MSTLANLRGSLRRSPFEVEVHPEVRDRAFGWPAMGSTFRSRGVLGDGFHLLAAADL
ncbi:MAG: hypothetical protein KJZ78_08450 [Bryobacteraceae bacterium]|nr:hypothetical protein [Bryobacteraceae bacterium]